jgi:plastocyanin
MAALTVARGEQVVFLNDDTVPHNIMSTTPDNAFDLGTQTPGDVTPVSFDKAGVVAVICAIHPRMHLTITVAN